MNGIRSCVREFGLGMDVPVHRRLFTFFMFDSNVFPGLSSNKIERLIEKSIPIE